MLADPDLLARLEVLESTGHLCSGGQTSIVRFPVKSLGVSEVEPTVGSK
jgi:hypothetical protein